MVSEVGSSLFEGLQGQFRKNETKKSPKELHYVFGEEASSYPCVCRVVKFCSDVVCPVNPLGGPKCGLHLISLADDPLLVPSVPVVFFLGRPTQWVVVTVNMTILDKLPVRFPEIELVGLNLLGKHTKTFLVEFQLRGEVGRLVVGVPTEMVDISVTVHDAGADLSPELHLGFRLAPDNGTEVRLVDADDAVGAPADVLVEHLLLLLVHLERSLEALVVMPAEAREEMARLLAKEIKECQQVSLQAAKLDQFHLVDELLSLTFLLGQRDEGLSSFHAAGLRLRGLVAGAELVKQAVYQLAAVFQKIIVGRIANLGVAACGVNLHRSPMIIASSSVRVFFGLLPSASDSIRVSWLKKSGSRACGPAQTAPERKRAFP